MYKFFTLALVVMTLSVYAADDTQVLDHEQIPANDITLHTFASCDAMTTVLKKYYKDALLDQITTNVGRPPIMYQNSTTTTAVPVAAPVDAPVSTSADKNTVSLIGGPGFSPTNNQIAGVDESDVVKTDGKYIYYASNQPDADGYEYVTITSADPKNLQLVRRIKLPSTYTNISLYLTGNQLTILANKWKTILPSTLMITPISLGNGETTIVVVYDVTDPSAPSLTRFYTVPGNLSQYRQVGDFLYVLSQNYITLNTWSGSSLFSVDEIAKYIDQKFSVRDFLPESIDMTPSSSTKNPYAMNRSLTKCTDIEYMLPDKPQNLSFLTLSIIPMKSNAPVTKKVIYGDISQFFMSQKNLYIVANYWNQGGDFSCPLGARCLLPRFSGEQNSIIHRMSVSGATVHYDYSVLTPGMPLSQYALDERDGIFFMVNQKDWTTNGVDIFAIDSTGKLLSKLEDIGPNERFQSARYIDNRLYLVTYQQKDPLSVIDTTNPSAMKVMGELTLPGYSTYLHPYDATHLIGLGVDTSSTGMTGGIKIDLYDVGDIAHPKQQYSQVFGGMGSTSEALTNPHAFVWDDVRHVVLFPAQLMDQDPTNYQFTSAWQGLLAVKIDTQSGIHEEARITHIDMTGLADKRKADCAQYKPVTTETKCYTLISTGEKVCVKPQDNPVNPTIPLYCYAEFDDSSYLANQIWNFSSSFVQRGLFIGNTVYTLSPSLIQANSYGSGYGFLGKIAIQ